MNKDKTSFGIRIGRDLVERLDEMVRESSYLGVSRSEVAEAISAAYFKSDVRHTEKAGELVILRRKGDL
jgi:metal-responsive CopG/Arc/MetJ family transcriptional regulator